jgi:hypothetical protein
VFYLSMCFTTQHYAISFRHFENSRNVDVPMYPETGERLDRSEAMERLKRLEQAAILNSRAQWGLAKRMQLSRIGASHRGILLYRKELLSTPSMREGFSLNGGIS